MAPSRRSQLAFVLLGVVAVVLSMVVMRQKPRTPIEMLYPRCHTLLPLQPQEDEGLALQSPPSKLERDWRPGDNTVLGNKEFDLVVFGATGFTGSLVATYLSSHYDPGVKWAVAGRSKAKLEALVNGFDPVINHAVGVIVADALDEASLASLMARTRVVVTTAGPYTDYGTLLVKACAEAGVHYADLSGEPFWQRRMVDEFDHVARRTGAKVVLASGFDSVPFDLGVFHALEAFRSAHNGDDEGKGKKSTPAVSEVTALVTHVRGWASGGTVASALKTAKMIWSGEVSSAEVADPYLLVPQDDAGVVGACRADTDVSGWGGALPRYDSAVGAVGIAHFMAPINARIVRRSLALKGLRNVSYAEGVSLGALADSLLWLGAKVVRGEFPVRDLAPKPGQGPSPVVMREGGGRVEFVATSPPLPPSDGLPQGRLFVRTEVAFVGDPGYNATSKMLAEAGLCLATPSCHLSDPMNQRGEAPLSEDRIGGVLTPAAAMGMGLLGRLRASDSGRFFTFRVLAAGVLE